VGVRYWYVTLSTAPNSQELTLPLLFAGNTFGATAFSSYGGFWISYAFIVSPWYGISASYAEAESTFSSGVAFFRTFPFSFASLRLC
jgi:succinate-acetate transporter protein